MWAVLSLCFIVGVFSALDEFLGKYLGGLAAGSEYVLVSLLIAFIAFALQYRKWKKVYNALYAPGFQSTREKLRLYFWLAFSSLFIFILGRTLYETLFAVVRGDGVIAAILYTGFKSVVALATTIKIFSWLALGLYCGIIAIGLTLVVIFHNYVNGGEINLWAFYEVIVEMVFGSLPARLAFILSVCVLLLQMAFHFALDRVLRI